MDEVKSMVEETISYKCDWCGHLYERERDADECALNHAKLSLANTMLKDGLTLESIEYWCNFRWHLTDNQKQITKDNCFIISHWQCCEKPAYRIASIEDGGFLRLWGVGGWSGGYGNLMSPDKLPTPHPPEEFYSYK